VDRRHFLRGAALASIGAGALVTQRTGQKIIEDLFPQVVTKDPATIFDPNEALSYFAHADTAQLLHLYNNFFGQITSLGAAALEKVQASVAQAQKELAAYDTAGQRRRHAAAAPALAIRQNSHSVDALLPTLAVHMQAISPSQVHTLDIHNEIIRGLLDPRNQVREIVLQNLVTALAPAQIGVGRFGSGQRAFFMQRAEHSDVLATLIEQTEVDPDGTLLRSYILQYLHSIRSVAELEEDGATRRMAQSLLVKLNSQADPLFLHQDALLRRLVGPRRPLSTPVQLTELVAAHGAAVTVHKIPFDMVESYALSYARYFQHVYSGMAGETADIMQKKINAFARDFDVGSIFKKSAMYERPILSTLPPDLAKFIEEQLVNAPTGANVHRSDEKRVVMMRQGLSSRSSGMEFAGSLAPDLRSRLLGALKSDDAVQLAGGIASLLGGLAMISEDEIIQGFSNRLQSPSTVRAIEDFVEKHESRSQNTDH